MFTSLHCVCIITGLTAVFSATDASSSLLDKLTDRQRPGRGVSRNSRCTDPWNYEPCVATNGTCGEGTKAATRPRRCGEPREKIKACVVPCTADGQAAVVLVAEAQSDIPAVSNVDGTRRGRGRGKGVSKRRRQNDRHGISEGVRIGKKGERRVKQNRRNKKKDRKAKRRERKPCMYEKTEWSSCNTDTNTQTRTLTLSRGGADVCVQNKTVSRSCLHLVTDCRYTKSVNQPCNKTAGEKQVTLTLTEDSPSDCELVKVITRPCGMAGQGQGRRGGRPKPKGKAGRKKKGKKDKCTTKGKNRLENRKERKSKRRSRKACQYSLSDWSTECTDNGTRTRIKTLIQSNQEASQLINTSECRSEIIIERPCYNKAGIARCFFGEWGEFGTCQNGVKTKHRSVVAGGDRCQRRAVKTKAC